MKRQNASANVIVPVVTIFLFTVGYIVTAYMTLDEETRRVPILAGYVTLFLLFLDCFRTFFLKKIQDKDILSGHSLGDEQVSLAREAKVISSVIGLVAGIYFIGFFSAIFLYLVFAISYLGKQSLKLSLPIALVTNLVVYLLFELGLEFQLFPGVLFS